MTRLEHVREISEKLSAEGLTAFDLLSWYGLTQLKWMTEDGKSDLNTWGLVAELDAALKRKAEDLDELHDSTFHSDMLKSQWNLY